jgi:hypothetical protein
MIRFNDLLQEARSNGMSDAELEDIFWDLDYREALNVLDEEDVNYTEQTLNGHKFVILPEEDKIITAPDSSYPEVNGIEDWFMRDMYSLGEIYEETEVDWKEIYNKRFWENVGRTEYELFHATQPKYVDKILDEGLNATNQTRGLKNKSIGNAVFTVTTPDRLLNGSYGDAILTIDVEAMKKDGYTPMVQKEPQYMRYDAQSYIAHKLNLYGFNHYGLEPRARDVWPETRVVHNDIPKRFLSTYE